MALNLYIYSGLGNIIAIVDSVREDISLDAEDVLNLHNNKNNRLKVTDFLHKSFSRKKDGFIACLKLVENSFLVLLQLDTL